MRYRGFARKLRRIGCVNVARRSGGSHRKWWNPATDRSAVIPDHDRRDLSIGALRSAIRKLGLDWREFNDA